MRRTFAATICLLFLFLSHAHAQQQQPTMKTYTTYINDRPLATESFRIEMLPGGVQQAEAEIAPVKGGSGVKQRVVTRVEANRPDSFYVEINGAKALTAQFADGSVSLTAAGQPVREVKTKATVILENLVWHQFVFLLGQYDHTRVGRQEFTAFLPSQGVDYSISIEEAAAASGYMVKGGTVKTHRYHLVAAGQLALELWTDETRAPLLFQVEAQKIKVVRQGAEDLATLAFAPPAVYRSPAYVVPASFSEQEVTVGGGGVWPLPATLTLPAGKGTFPAVVLVHGSGANDRDETLRANKPFRDLAQGLASQGIAVLRYEKRMKEHESKVVALPNFTVKEETIDDALAAVRLLRATPGIDAKRIFVLGHSLGGMLVPRIGVGDTSVAGFIIFAGATRPLEEMMVQQYEYLSALDGSVSEAERAKIEEVKRQAALIKQLKPGETSTPTLLYAPPGYWLDLRGYQPPVLAQSLKRPMLVLQGERDYNVTMDDFRNWQTALAGRREVEFKSYPKLDHLFFEGEGAASGADYERPRNIPAYVINDIAAWVKRQR